MDLPSGPLAKTPCSQFRGPGFDPWSGNWIPRAASKIQCSQNKTNPGAVWKNDKTDLIKV